ncbi:hypothetical protein PORY_002678, partial [Pneumocystis oryctolagi]
IYSVLFSFSTQEPLVSKETTLDTGFLSSRPRSAALDVQTLQHQKPRRHNFKDHSEFTNLKKKTILENNIFEESLNSKDPSFSSSFVSHVTINQQLSPISHSTPNKKQLNDITLSSECLGALNDQELSNELYKNTFGKSSHISPEINDSEKVVLEGFGSSPSSILHRDTSYSSFLEKSPKVLEKDENVLFLTDLIKKYKDTERQTNALIISHEQHIDELESKIESLSLELKDKKKELFEANSREKGLFSQITVLEKELEKLQHDLYSWEEKYSNMKVNHEEQLNEIDNINKMLKEKESELLKSERLIKDLKDSKDSLETERFLFSDKISALKKQCQELELKNQELEEHKFENMHLNDIIERLNYDLEEIKKERLKDTFLDKTINIKTNSMSLENELLLKSQDNEIKEGILVKFMNIYSLCNPESKTTLNDNMFSINTRIKTSNKGIQVNTLQETNLFFKDKNDTPLLLNSNDFYKTVNFTNENMENSKEISDQCNILSHEMNLQNRLIEKLFYHKFKTPKKINKFLKNNLKSNKSFLFFNNSFFKKYLNWIVLISYVCITLFIGIWITHQEWFLWFGKKPAGITYAELKAWKQANSLNFKLYENGIINFRRTWLEGNWRWLNCLGWWIDNSIRDINIQWPS